MNINEYVIGIVAIAVYAVCIALHAISFIPNKYLPIIAILLGVIFNAWYTWSFTFPVFVGGLASGLCAVGIDQGKDMIINIFKEVRKDESENDR